MAMRRLLIALDRMCCAAIGGQRGETLSGCAWRMQTSATHWAVARWCIDFLFFLSPNHCQRAYEAEARARTSNLRRDRQP